MEFPFALNIKLFFGNDGEAKVVHDAILLETKAKHQKRSITKTDINKNVLHLNIIAKDLTALKASSNTLLKLIALSEDLAKSIS